VASQFPESGPFGKLNAGSGAFIFLVRLAAIFPAQIGAFSTQVSQVNTMKRGQYV
jgi:hypothetical protein